MEFEKAISKSISLPPSLWERIDKHAQTHFANNRSAFLKPAIESALNGTERPKTEIPSKENENFFVDLCDALAGHTATERAKKAFEKLKISQRTFTEHILKRASIAAKWLSEHPEAKYDGLRFQHSNEYSESYKSSSPKPSPISKVI